MEIAELERYVRERLKALGLSESDVKGNYDSWLYADRRVVVTRLKEKRGKWLGAELSGRWHIEDKEGVNRFIEEHVKPMIDELKRQEGKQEL